MNNSHVAVYLPTQNPQTLFMECFRPIYRFLFSRLNGDADLAAELAQDVFAIMLKKFDRLDWSRPYPLLLKIAQDLLSDHLRSRGKRMDLNPALEAAAQSLLDLKTQNPADVLESRESAICVSKIMSGLPLHYQKALTMKYVEELSLAEIAKAFGETERAVKSRLERARQAFLEKSGELRKEWGA